MAEQIAAKALETLGLSGLSDPECLRRAAECAAVAVLSLQADSGAEPLGAPCKKRVEELHDVGKVQQSGGLR